MWIKPSAATILTAKASSTSTRSWMLHLIYLSCLITCSVSDQEGGRWRNNQLSVSGENVKIPGDRFETQNNSVVTSQVGASVILHCKTSSATGGLVSWIRKRDYQLLTVGLHTHSSDDRFTINYVHWDWQLHIRYVQPRDAGAYECQVSSYPPTSLFVHLQVFEAESEILGAPEKHVKLGTILQLVCIMHHTTEPLSYVFWYRGSEMINYESDDAGTGSVRVESDDHTSVLMVSKASRQHSGNYTCAPSNTKPASILIHVLNGEHPAAMQHGEASGLVKAPPHVLILLMVIAIQILFWMPLANPLWKYGQRSPPSCNIKIKNVGASAKLVDHGVEQDTSAILLDNIEDTHDGVEQITSKKLMYSLVIRYDLIVRGIRDDIPMGECNDVRLYQHGQYILLGDLKKTNSVRNISKSKYRILCSGYSSSLSDSGI